VDSAAFGAAGILAPHRESEVIPPQFSLGAVAVLMGASLMLMLSQNWRWSLAAFGVQYLGVFWLVAQSWPVGLAAVKLVIGLVAGAVLAASRPTEELLGAGFSGLPGRIFKTLASFLVWALVFSIAPVVQRWLPADLPTVQGALVLVGMGLLQLGMSNQPLRVVIGLLTVLAGFEIMYASIEASVLVAGLMGVVNLGLALTGAYILITPGLTEDGEFIASEEEQ
jgi:hypothetical protein